MCGIIGAVAQREVVDFLLQGLKRLEYRGYDSAGLAVLDGEHVLQRLRRVGKVQVLADAVAQVGLQGHVGIAHTRWATHGVPSEENAHPHICRQIVIVHNGIIENHLNLREQQQRRGYNFSSDTDSEVIASLVDWEQRGVSEGCLLTALHMVLPQLRGSYGIVAMDVNDPSTLVAACAGSPLVIGYGLNEQFIASDQQALLPFTRVLSFLQPGDLAKLTTEKVSIFNSELLPAKRPLVQSAADASTCDKGGYRHYMQKEIYEQPVALKNALQGRTDGKSVHLSELGTDGQSCLAKVEHLQILACGTSYHAASVARYWFEALSGIQCDVEISSEFRYRNSVTRRNSLLIVLSQSGETADSLAALRLAKSLNYLASLAICNIPGSTLTREADFTMTTNAGVEIGVASTKAFTTQLAVLLLLVAYLGSLNGRGADQEEAIVGALQRLPGRVEHLLTIDNQIESLAKNLTDRGHALFIARGEYHPVAMEGALKLKEISYIHAEGHPAGELKHGPLALVDKCMPVIVLAPGNTLIEKLQSNVEEVRARGGELYIFCDQNTKFANEDGLSLVRLPITDPITAPICYAIALQLLAYHVAALRGTDVDQPRNLAKSVTVE